MGDKIGVELSKALDFRNTYPVYFCGGTICIDFSPDVPTLVNLGDRSLTNFTLYCAAKLYIRHKTDKCAYWTTAKNLIRLWEGTFGQLEPL